ncbi:MAG: endonuclease/exonuclease/phosphatase family protein [Akkermansiaceae bacterium]|jgi:endonuclease/exonuclease/phosphatase family metal-dependent hydrolase
MRKSSLWLRFAYCLGATLLIFTATWFFQRAETPPWRQELQKISPLTESVTQANHPRSKRTTTAAFRFVTYNLKNWLTSSQNPEKSNESKNAIVEILIASDADIIGLSEIGSEADVLEIQKLLKQTGKDLPHFYHTGGTDPIRHLAILSRFPIVSTTQPEITITGTEHSMLRGILDASIQIQDQTIRFIGIHLKSKRIVPDYDQEELRIHEAEHVRKYIDSIFSKNPETHLIAYGDFNDHIESLSTKTILGNYRSQNHLTPIHISDQNGDNWTHYFGSQDSYSRIDFITVSKSLKPIINQKKSRIITTPNWQKASDHRAIMVSFD